MTNKEAIDDLKNFRAGLGAGCRLPIGERGLEIQRTHIHAISQAIKSLEAVEKIQKAFHNGWFEDDIYNILCEFYGTEEDRESWLKEEEND